MRVSPSSMPNTEKYHTVWAQWPGNTPTRVGSIPRIQPPRFNVLFNSTANIHNIAELSCLTLNRCRTQWTAVMSNNRHTHNIPSWQLSHSTANTHTGSPSWQLSCLTANTHTGSPSWQLSCLTANTHTGSPSWQLSCLTANTHTGIAVLFDSKHTYWLTSWQLLFDSSPSWQLSCLTETVAGRGHTPGDQVASSWGDTARGVEVCKAICKPWKLYA